MEVHVRRNSFNFTSFYVVFSKRHAFLIRGGMWKASKPHKGCCQKAIRAALLFYPPRREPCPSRWTSRSLLWLHLLGDAPSFIDKSIVVRSGTANVGKFWPSNFRVPLHHHSPSPQIFVNSSFVSFCPWVSAFSPNDEDNKERILCKLSPFFLSTQDCCSQNNC